MTKSVTDNNSANKVSSSVTAEARKILLRLSIKQRATLCSGKDFWNLQGLPQHDLPSIMVTDGPHGLRKQRDSSDHLGLLDSVPAVCFPSAAGLASSWSRELLLEVGEALGEECLQERVSVLLGPGVNIKRSPLCGRNFEYFSEDPYLSGQIGSAWVNGVQSQGIGTSLKHYAVNNQESHRMVVDTIVDERTLREIYLPAFETVVKKSQPWTVMCSYNLLNGCYLSDNKHLLTDILKDEWGHTGLVVTDWGASNDRVKGIAAGLELDMPGNNAAFVPGIVAAVESGELTEDALDAATIRVIELILRSKPALNTTVRYSNEEHHQLAQRAAEQSCVLLKNENKTLPLTTKGEITVIGALAKNPRYQGAGSSQVTPTRLETPLEEITKLLGERARVNYAAGYSLDEQRPNEAYIQEAMDFAARSDQVILIVGLPEIYESEGFDREHLHLPPGQLALIECLTKITDRLIIVLQNGAPVEMPFANKVGAILEAYLGGQAGGAALARILFGQVNPSGKLAETFPLALEDTPCCEWFPGEPRQVQYREGIWVGYRYYNAAGIPVLFPFGHGLSYTSFEYSDLRIEFIGGSELDFQNEGIGDHHGISVYCRIENTGDVAGYETIQLYVGNPIGAVHRPEYELREFTKIWLEPGASKEVELNLGRRAFTFWDTKSSSWQLEAGEYKISLGSSSTDLRAWASLPIKSLDQIASTETVLEGYFTPAYRAFCGTSFSALLGQEIPESIPVKPFHHNSTLGEISETLVGWLLVKLIHRKAIKEIGGGEKERRIIDAMIMEMPVRNLLMLSQGRIPIKFIDVLIHILNKNILTAFKVSRKKYPGNG